jgi:hypothetical protein
VLDDVDGLASRSTRAMELGCDAMAEETLRIADTPVQAYEIQEGPLGRTVTVKDALGHRRLQIETRMRLLGKWSKRYAEKAQLEANVKGTLGVTLSATEQDAAL